MTAPAGTDLAAPPVGADLAARLSVGADPAALLVVGADLAALSLQRATPGRRLQSP